MLTINATGVPEVQPPKFNVGDKVHCYRADNGVFMGFDFVGEVTKLAQVDDTYEYWVTNAPMLPFADHPVLIWESEMAKAPMILTPDTCKATGCTTCDGSCMHD